MKIIGDGQQAQIIKHLTAHLQLDSLYHHIAIGSPAIRKKVAETELEPHTPLYNVSFDAPHLPCPCHFRGHGAYISPVNTSIGFCVFINTHAVIEHDCTIGDYVNVNPGAILCGGVTVGNLSTIGAGAIIREGITIGEGVTIGAGSVVTKNVPDGAIWAGIPARRLNRRKKSKLTK